MQDRDELVELLKQLADLGVDLSLRPAKRPEAIIAGNWPGLPGSKQSRCYRCNCLVALSTGIECLALYPDVPIFCLRCTVAARREELKRQ